MHLSKGTWVAIAVAALLWGGVADFVLSFMLGKPRGGLSASSPKDFAAGCLLPVLIGLLSGFGRGRFLPEDPCGGAFTPDAIFIPAYVVMLTSGAAVALVWIKAWRK